MPSLGGSDTPDGVFPLTRLICIHVCVVGHTEKQVHRKLPPSLNGIINSGAFVSNAIAGPWLTDTTLLIQSSTPSRTTIPTGGRAGGWGGGWGKWKQLEPSAAEAVEAAEGDKQSINGIINSGAACEQFVLCVRVGGGALTSIPMLLW